MKERDLYPGVAQLLKDHFGCIAVEQTTGPQYGNVDVVGVRYSHNRYGGAAELIAVEVKLRKTAFLKSVGQTLGYSLMADRCYLAVHDSKGFSQIETEMAAQLNVGLIHIRDKSHSTVALSSPQHRPMPHRRLALMRKLEYVECVICARPVHRDKMRRFDVQPVGTKDFERRWICEGCANGLKACLTR